MSTNQHDQVTTISRRVGANGVCVKGRWYNGPELADLVGEVISIDLVEEDSLTAVATFEGRSFQLRSDPYRNAEELSMSEQKARELIRSVLIEELRRGGLLYQH